MDSAIERYRQAILQEKQRRRMTWDDVSDIVGVTVQHIRRIAHKAISPTLENGARVLETLGIGMWIGAPQGEGLTGNNFDALTYDELCMMDGEPVWMELANGKWVCVLIYQRSGAPVALGLSVFATGQTEPVQRLLDEGFAFYRSPPKGGIMWPIK